MSKVSSTRKEEYVYMCTLLKNLPYFQKAKHASHHNLSAIMAGAYQSRGFAIMKKIAVTVATNITILVAVSSAFGMLFLRNLFPIITSFVLQSVVYKRPILLQ